MKTSIFKSLLFFAIVSIAAIQCTKSEDGSVDSSTNEVFYSSELTETLGTYFSEAETSNFFNDESIYDSYVAIIKEKKATQTDEAYVFTAYATNKDGKMDNFKINSTNIPLYSSGYANYSFSSPYNKVEINGQETHTMPTTTSFSAINFDLGIEQDDNTVNSYTGTFPSLTPLAINSSLESSGAISINQGINIDLTNGNSQGSILIEIVHMASVIGQIQPTKKIIVNDGINYNLNSTILSDYNSGDEINISFFRDSYLLQNRVLIRSIEGTYFLGIELI